jgi:hypothetical protein
MRQSRRQMIGWKEQKKTAGDLIHRLPLMPCCNDRTNAIAA